MVVDENDEKKGLAQENKINKGVGVGTWNKGIWAKSMSTNKIDPSPGQRGKDGD